MKINGWKWHTQIGAGDAASTGIVTGYAWGQKVWLLELSDNICILSTYQNLKLPQFFKERICIKMRVNSIFSYIPRYKNWRQITRIYEKTKIWYDRKICSSIGGYRMDHPIQGLMTTAMQHLKQMTDVNTIVGDPIKAADGSVILTVSKVSFGFAAGGSEFGKVEHSGRHPFGGEVVEEFLLILLPFLL